MPDRRRKTRAQKGSTLVFVLIVFAVMMILITALLSFALTATKVTAGHIVNTQDRLAEQSAVK
jgi:Tfp pilus assembly protein PilX